MPGVVSLTHNAQRSLLCYFNLLASFYEPSTPETWTLPCTLTGRYLLIEFALVCEGLVHTQETSKRPEKLEQFNTHLTRDGFRHI